MMRRTVAALARLTAARLAGDDRVQVTGIAIDSREVRPGNLFVALPGAHVDGHDFVADAEARGAAAVLVSRSVRTSLPLLLVEDTLAALHCLAAAERLPPQFKLVGITGSVGKTTTKEFLAALLATTYPTGSSRGSRNSQAGLPAEICNQPDDIAWMVAEMGMNHAGELDRLGAVARPDAMLYTVIAPVHIEFFGTLERIAEAKAEVLPHLRPEGVLVLNAADPFAPFFASRFCGRVVRYGVPGESDLWLENYQGAGLRGASFILRSPTAAVEIVWHLAGRHQADNLVAAAACAMALGVPSEQIPAAARSLEPAPRRGQIHELPGGVTVVDDSYNASPVAVEAALALLAETSGRRIAVLGEMRELGEATTELHRRVGRAAARAADLLITVGGEPSRAMAAAAAGIEVHCTADAMAAAELLRPLLRPGDVVLVKGSRGVALDRAVDLLLGKVA
ncbi:MAG: UDP-N-acetylmuramoyl-tripeptide--D-alanyl-D-alanine ligase [Acidobacteriota bacterium]|jgi:UDP-N-acetylmuramoyl-tripeptide--D-alanyl-D-alanine ligase